MAQEGALRISPETNWNHWGQGPHMPRGFLRWEDGGQELLGATICGQSKPLPLNEVAPEEVRAEG